MVVAAGGGSLRSAASAGAGIEKAARNQLRAAARSAFWLRESGLEVADGTKHTGCHATKSIRPARTGVAGRARLRAGYAEDDFATAVPHIGEQRRA